MKNIESENKWLDNRPLIMGILNITPDSFSDGGRFISRHEAIEQAFRMVCEGADIIDIGGESTRPGAPPINPKIQLERVLPIIQMIRTDRRFAKSIKISIDTSSSLVAREAIRCGANIVNDVTAGLGDSHMLKTVSNYNAPIILMHMKGIPENMQINPTYEDVIKEVLRFLNERTNAAKNAGILDNNILIDPGIGFGKTSKHNLQLMRHLNDIVRLGYPVVLGCSRKRFMGSICKVQDAVELLGATVATTVMGLAQGVRIFRVHDVRENRQAVDLASAINAI